MPGRKSVIYLSTGMYETPDLDEPFRNLMSHANRANVTFYSVDARGVMTTAQNREVSRQLSAAAASATTVNRTEGAVTKEPEEQLTRKLIRKQNGSLSNSHRKFSTSIRSLPAWSCCMYRAQRRSGDTERSRILRGFPSSTTFSLVLSQ